MTVRPIDPQAPDFAESEAFRDACTLLLDGELVAVPTETVYGLAADATNDDACARIFTTKDRPPFNPLICHFADADAAREFAVFDARADILAAAFWPGPLTLVVPRRPYCSISDRVTVGKRSVAVRVPDAPVMRALAAAIDRPLAAPSANLSGRISPTTAEAVAEDLGDRVALILDAGPARVGVESTIVSLVGEKPRLLRPGGVPREAIEAALGEPLADRQRDTGDRPQAPGMLASHYAPRARVRLAAEDVAPGEAYLGFGPPPPDATSRAAAYRNLSESGDLAEAAANLFGHLRALDATGAAVIAVAPIPMNGLGEAINDRLARAAADRTGPGARVD